MHTVLNEYASRFFVLLQRGLEIQNEQKGWALTVADYPYLKQDKRKQILADIANTTPNEPDTIKINQDRKKLRELFKRKK